MPKIILVAIASWANSLLGSFRIGDDFRKEGRWHPLEEETLNFGPHSRANCNGLHSPERIQRGGKSQWRERVSLPVTDLGDSRLITNFLARTENPRVEFRNFFRWRGEFSRRSLIFFLSFSLPSSIVLVRK